MFARKTYTRIKDRQIRDGKIDVSREELEDFRNKFGKTLTLRDLLNYDRTGKLPGDKAKAAPASEPAAKPKSASQSAGERLAAYDRAVSTMPEGTSTAAREALMKSRDAARDAYEQAAEAERAGRPVVKTGAKSAAERVGETTLASRAEAAERRAMEAVDRQRAERAEQMRQADLMRPGRDAITPTLGPELGLAAAARMGLPMLAGAVARNAPRAVEAVRDAVARPSSEGWVRPDLRKEFEAFRRGDQAAMEQARKVREAAEAAARARTKPAAESGRPADTRIEPTRGGELKLDEFIYEPSMGGSPSIPSRLEGVPFKKGGKVSSGRGDGIAKRGKTKGRYI